MQKYDLTGIWKTVDGIIVYQIQALISFGDVTKGSLGGWIESERNLSQKDTAWVYEDAVVMNNAKVLKNGKVFRRAKVYGHARIAGNALVGGDAQVFGHARVEKGTILGNAQISAYARVVGNVSIDGTTSLSGKALIRKDSDLICIHNADRENGALTAYRTVGGIRVDQASFSGTLERFDRFVEQTYGNTDYAKEMKTLIQFIQLRLKSSAKPKGTPRKRKTKPHTNIPKNEEAANDAKI